MANHRSDRNLPRWRSVLFIPAHETRFIQGAHKRKANAVILDLEDSVSAAKKQSAREALASHIEQLASNDIDVLIRINRDLSDCLADIEASAIPNVKAIAIPKVLGPDHIRLIDEYITSLEQDNNLQFGQIRLIAMIETLEALAKIQDIAQSSKRLVGLLLGSEDLCLDGGFEPTSQNLFYPAQQLVLAAKQARIAAYGFPGSIADYSNSDHLQQQIGLGKSMGFDGVFCIHPSQVAIANSLYQPNPKELIQAKKIVDAYEEAIAQGIAAIEVDGKMVDHPVFLKAKNSLPG